MRGKRCPFCGKFTMFRMIHRFKCSECGLELDYRLVIA